MSTKAQDALSFIRSVGIITGDVISVNETSNEIDFSVRYLPNNQITHLIYSESNSNITVIIDEGTAVNEVIFWDNGNVTLDGQPFPYYGNNVTNIDSGYYIYQYYDTLPSGWSEPSEDTRSRINDVIGATSWTVSSLATVIALKAPTWHTKAVAIASWLISTVTGPVADYFGFSIDYTTWKNLDRSPFLILTKSRLIITIDDVVEYDDTTYELATLT